MIKFGLNLLTELKTRFDSFRKIRRWERLRKKGMKIGTRVNLPMSTWIDVSHCFLISIGDKVGFGENCAILAHDAMPDEYINATRIGKVVIHESCHFGMGTIILPGVEIGPRSVVGSGSVVINDIPPNTLAAGNPAKVICTLDEFLDKHSKRIKSVPLFQYKLYDEKVITPERKEEMLKKLEKSQGYMIGGYTTRNGKGYTT